MKKHPSSEQQLIINSITNNKNVVVNAVAGSGKTTTLLFIAENNKNKKILQITYNAELKNEVRKKVIDYELSNIDIHTYHSLGTRFYDPNCYTDAHLIEILNENKQVKQKPNYDILVIDETQDMTANYYELICKFIKDSEFSGNILILGDHYQGIYEFKSADTRYLLLYNKIYNRDFEPLTLNESYRVTTNIASFVNEVMLGKNRIISNKKISQKVLYYKINIYKEDGIQKIFNNILQFLKQYKPEDIFILAPSLKNFQPSTTLENLLVDRNIPVYYTRKEEDGIDSEKIANKIVFTTFHQSKGRERKIVIVFGFDESYFTYYAKNKDPQFCPSELYVAITRASEILVVVEQSSQNSPQFIKRPPYECHGFVQYITDNSNQVNKNKKQDKKTNKDDIPIHKITVTDLTAYINEKVMNLIIPLIPMLFQTITESNNVIDMPLIFTNKKKLVEDVSDINGIAIPSIYESHITNKKSTLETIVDDLLEINIKGHSALVKSKVRELKKYPNKSIQKYLLTGNLYIALIDKIHSKLKQIDSYDWLTQPIIDQCINNLSANINPNASYEKTICCDKDGYHHSDYGTIYVGGRIDACDDSVLWELKCVGSLHTENLLQLIIYAWLWEKYMKVEFGIRKYRILNFRTGEVRELVYKPDIIDQVMDLLFINKYDPKMKDKDDIFVEKCLKVFNKYIS